MNDHSQSGGDCDTPSPSYFSGSLEAKLYDQIRTPILILDVNGTILYLNSAGQALVGLTSGDAAGKSVWQVVDKSAETQYLKTLFNTADCLQTLEQYGFQWSPRDNTYAAIVWQCQISDEDGCRAIICTGTTSKISEYDSSTVRAGEEILRQVIEHVEEVFWMMNAEHTEMIFISPGYEKVWQRSCQDLIKNPQAWLEDIHSDDVDEVAKAFETEWLSGFDKTYRIVRPDGSTRWIRDRAFPVYNEKGEPYRVAGIAQDVTLLISKRERLDQQTNQLDKYFEWSQDLLAIAGSDTKFIRVNRQMEKTLGYGPGELVGHSFFEFIHPQDAKKTKNLMLDMGQGFEPSGFENRYRCKNGEYRIFEWNAFQASNMFFGTGRDVTKRRELEKQIIEAKETAEKANLEKSNFLSSMSHELRTPLNAILGFAQLIQITSGDAQDAKQEEFASQIIDGGQHLLKLIDDILDLARIEAGKAHLYFETFSISELIEEGFRQMKVLADEQRISLEKGKGCRTSTPVFADKTRVKQVFLNLMSNAIKYNKENGSVTVFCDVSQNGSFRVSVKDTGYGIPEKQWPDLFKPFNRLGYHMSDIAGTGIGLVVSKNLITLMGGNIGFESTENHGTTFWFELPIAKYQGKTLGSLEAAPNRLPQSVAENIVILYVEDNLPNVQLMKSIIDEMEGMRLIVCRQAEEGIEIANEEIPDLILLDVNLPEMSGLEAAKILRESPKTTHIPIVGVSALAMQSDIDAGLKAGFDKYLIKPIQVVDLVNAINELIKPSARE